jgi:hypothetical protein
VRKKKGSTMTSKNNDRTRQLADRIKALDGSLPTEDKERINQLLGKINALEKQDQGHPADLSTSIDSLKRSYGDDWMVDKYREANLRYLERSLNKNAYGGFVLANILLNLGAFASGIYQGIYASKGTLIDPTLQATIRYAPLVISGALGITRHVVAHSKGQLANIDDPLERKILSMLPFGAGFDSAEAIAFVGRPIIYVSITAGCEYLGYVVGTSMAKL